MELEVKGIEVDCIIGERDYERSLIQRLTVDVSVETDGRAAETDDLHDAVDYVALADAIRARLVNEKCKLVERAALVAAKACLEVRGVKSAKVAVTKAGAVPGIKSATVKAALANE